MKKTETTEIVLEERGVQVSLGKGDEMIYIKDITTGMNGSLFLINKIDTLIKLLTEIKKYL